MKETKKIIQYLKDSDQEIREPKPVNNKKPAIKQWQLDKTQDEPASWSQQPQHQQQQQQYSQNYRTYSSSASNPPFSAATAATNSSSSSSSREASSSNNNSTFNKLFYSGR